MSASMRFIHFAIIGFLFISCGSSNKGGIRLNLEQDLLVKQHLAKYKFCDGSGNCLYFANDEKFTWKQNGEFKENGYWRLGEIEHGMRQVIHHHTSSLADQELSRQGKEPEWTFYLNEAGIYWYIAQDGSKMMFLPEPRGTDAVNENGVLLTKFFNPTPVGSV